MTDRDPTAREASRSELDRFTASPFATAKYPLGLDRVWLRAAWF